MGFGRKSRRRAQEAQWQVFLNAQSAAQQAQARLEELFRQQQQDMSGIRELQQRALGRLARWDAGKDVSSIYPAIWQVGNEGAEAVRRTLGFTGGLGANALSQPDVEYQRKLQVLAGRDIAKGVSSGMVQSALQERGMDVNTVLQTGGLLGNLTQGQANVLRSNIENWLNLGSFITTIRQMEQNRTAMIWNNLANILSGASGLMSGIGMLRMMDLMGPASMTSGALSQTRPRIVQFPR